MSSKEKLVFLYRFQLKPPKNYNDICDMKSTTQESWSHIWLTLFIHEYVEWLVTAVDPQMLENIFVYQRYPKPHYRPGHSTVHSQYLEATFLQITYERHPYLAREGELWVPFVSLKCDRSFTFEVVVLCAITCYISPRYIESLWHYGH